MTIKVEIVKDSVSTWGPRITTFLLTYPRFIHAELMTHRVLSRNASSSRAIPVSKALRAIHSDLAQPVHWGSNKPGMQAGAEVVGWRLWAGKRVWSLASKFAIGFAWTLDKLGLHKQIVNRITEPFSHITVVVTATEYANFFALRYHPMAQPEICELAKLMWNAYSTSTPTIKRPGDWHLPFISDPELAEAMIFGAESPEVMTLVRKSVACCARTSYKNHDKSNTTQAENDGLYQRLVGSDPKHSSCAEHQATSMNCRDEWSGNFRGWNQHRKSIPNENILVFQPLADRYFDSRFPVKVR